MGRQIENLTLAFLDLVTGFAFVRVRALFLQLLDQAIRHVRLTLAEIILQIAANVLEDMKEIRVIDPFEIEQIGIGQLAEEGAVGIGREDKIGRRHIGRLRT